MCVQFEPLSLSATVVCIKSKYDLGYVKWKQIIVRNFFLFLSFFFYKRKKVENIQKTDTNDLKLDLCRVAQYVSQSSLRNVIT